MSISLFSPAKVNLFLRILSRRDDGYHNLASLFQAINFGDSITLTLSERDHFSCTRPHIPQDHTNLIMRSIDLFRHKTGLKFCLNVQLEKKIPMQSGLGGGSSNAATTLWGLNQLLNTNIKTETLQTWSAEIGSDIPFFFSLGTAFCTERGERVVNLEPINLPLTFSLITHKSGLSTPLVFQTLQKKTCSSLDPYFLLEQFFNGNPILLNDLEKPAFTLLPELRKLKVSLQANGNLAVMTGSGTAFLTASFKGPCTQGFPIQFIQRECADWYTPSSGDITLA